MIPCVVNLSEGRLGEDEDATSLFGALLVSTLARLAMERADQPEDTRRDFGVYFDEVQLFATLSVANMLAELRKYRVHMTVGHQHLAQLEPTLRDAILGTVGTVVAFRVGAADARALAPILGGEIEPADLTRLPNAKLSSTAGSISLIALRAVFPATILSSDQSDSFASSNSTWCRAPSGKRNGEDSAHISNIRERINSRSRPHTAPSASRWCWSHDGHWLARRSNIRSLSNRNREARDCADVVIP